MFYCKPYKYILILHFFIFLALNTYPQNGFFKHVEKVKNLSNTFLVFKNGEKKTISDFLLDNYIGGKHQIGLIDIDNDGKKELFMKVSDLCAHSCTDYYFFKKIGKQVYELTAQTSRDEMRINKDSTFTYSLADEFGYFYTCFGCNYTNKNYAEVNNIKLRYAHEKLLVVPGSVKLKHRIINNLKIITRKKMSVVQGDDFDSGERKAFALNLAVYYYTFGKNINASKKLFDTYFKSIDAKEVWQRFVDDIKEIKENNTF